VTDSGFPYRNNSPLCRKQVISQSGLLLFPLTNGAAKLTALKQIIATFTEAHPGKSVDIDIHLLLGSDRVADQNRGLLSLAVPEEEQCEAHHQGDDDSDDGSSGHFH
jgi:hypothetical protein